MKRVILLIAVLTATVWLSSCESRRFQFVATLNKTVDFDVDHSGAFKTVRTITAAQIRNNLNVPEGSTIKRVDIEALAIVPETKAGNEANEVKVRGTIKDQGHEVELFKETSINLTTGVDIGYGVRVPLQKLVDLGVAALKTKINDHVNRLNDADIEINLYGTTLPSGKRLLMTVHFDIKATVLYEKCIDTPNFFGGEKCEEGEKDKED